MQEDGAESEEEVGPAPWRRPQAKRMPKAPNQKTANGKRRKDQISRRKKGNGSWRVLSWQCRIR
eukprot:1886131-Prorocentrum_lima.AAC.1